MSKIVILGNSAAGFSVCDTLIKNQAAQELTVISPSNSLPYKRSLLIDYLAGNIPESEIFLCSQDYYEKNKVRFFKEAKAARVDTKKNLVVLKDNTKIKYDYLVIATGSRPDISDIPGNSKDGVFTFYSLDAVKKIKDRMMITDTVCILADADLASRLAEVFSAKDKQVKIISSPKHEGFTQTEIIEWIEGLSLSEIIGEGAELKAVKLTNGKAIGCSLVLFASNYRPSSEFLKETEVKTEQGYIIVDFSLRTNLENIFACGSICKNENYLKTKSWDDAIREGYLVAQELLKTT